MIRPDLVRPDHPTVRLARRTIFGRAIFDRLAHPTDEIPPNRPFHPLDPAREILALHELRQAVLDQQSESNATADASSPTPPTWLDALLTATQAPAFFTGIGSSESAESTALGLYRPVPVGVTVGHHLAGPRHWSDLTALLINRLADESSIGVVVRGPPGCGKTIALCRAWYVCLGVVDKAVSTPLDQALPLWLPPSPTFDEFRETDDQDWQPIVRQIASAVRCPALARPLDGETRSRRVEYYLRHGPRLLIFCPLHHVPSEARVKFAQALTAFQRWSRDQNRPHTCVIVDDQAFDSKTGRVASRAGHSSRYQFPAELFEDWYEFRDWSESQPLDYLAAHQQFARTVREACGIAAALADELSARGKALQRLLEVRRSQRLAIGLPLLMHAAASRPLEQIERSRHPLTLLREWRESLERANKVVPPALDRTGGTFDRLARCEQLLDVAASAAFSCWNHPDSALRECPSPRYVEPHYVWLGNGNEPEAPSTEEPLSAVTDANQYGIGNQQLAEIICRGREANRSGAGSQDETTRRAVRLLFVEDANAGKTVFTKRLKHFASDPAEGAGRRPLFDGLPGLVVRFENRAGQVSWPRGHDAASVGRDLLTKLEEAIRNACSSQQFPCDADEPRACVEYALGHGRVLLIFDAIDQVGGTLELRRLFECLNEPDSPFARVHVVVTGRRHFFDWQEDSPLACTDWCRMTVRGFDRYRQARFLYDVLPIRWRNASADWSVTVPDVTELFGHNNDLGELLTIPGLLAIVRDFLESQDFPTGRDFTHLDGSYTRADIHWRYWEAELRRGRNRSRAGSSSARENDDDGGDGGAHAALCQAMLAVTAFRMTLQGCDNFMIDDPHVIDAVKRDVESYCERLSEIRYDDGHPVHPQLARMPRPRRWDAHWERLSTLGFLSEPTTTVGELVHATLNWRHKSWMEFFAGLFLAGYLRADCLRAFQLARIRVPSNGVKLGYVGVNIAGTTHSPSDSVRITNDLLSQIANDPRWTWPWRYAIDLPRVAAFPPVSAESWGVALSALFRRPPRGPRPTELMFRAWQTFQAGLRTLGDGRAGTSGCGLDSELQAVATEILAEFQDSFVRLLQSDAELPADRFQVETLPASERRIANLAAQLIPPPRASELIRNHRISAERWQSLGTSSSETTETRSAPAASSFALIPQSGDFFDWALGVNGSGPYLRYAGPQFSIRVAPFWVQTALVSRGQFLGLFDSYRLSHQADANGLVNPQGPVAWVTWYDAFCFALWIAGELPLEQQWEAACLNVTAAHGGSMQFPQAEMSGTTSPTRGYVRSYIGKFSEWTADCDEYYTHRWERVLAGCGPCLSSPSGRSGEGAIDVAAELKKLSDDDWRIGERLQRCHDESAARIMRSPAGKLHERFPDAVRMPNVATHTTATTSFRVTFAAESRSDA